LAFELALKGEVPTARQLGHALDVNPSTIVRWLPERALENFKVIAELAAKGEVKVYQPTLGDEMDTSTGETGGKL
jgi:hypothetical protein